MRLLGGILRPSRNQVTCGRGKLAMRGARMTAASPWETLWCFSPSSKLPMSAGGKSIRGGQIACSWAGSGGGRMTVGGRRPPGSGHPPDPITPPPKPIIMTWPASCFWG